MPVCSISVLLSSSSNFGGSRWIGQRSVTVNVEASSLRQSPVTFHTRPLVTSPTGTLMGAPVSYTAEPRRMPSVGLRAIARTTLSPTCSATSSVIDRFSPLTSISMVSAL